MRIRELQSRVVPFLIAGALACVPQVPPPIGPAQATAYEPVWEAMLASLRDGKAAGEVDRILPGLLDSTPRPAPPPLRLVLEERRDSGFASYRFEWVAKIVQSGLVDTICLSRGGRGCGGATLTSFLRLGDRVIVGDSAATLEFSDVTKVPAQCEGQGHGGFVGIHFSQATLSRQSGGWRIDSTRFTMTGSGYCGEFGPETRRLMREDSAVQRRRSPVAGTWRYVVTLPEGDSLVVFARTALRPGSTLRHRRLAETRAHEGERDHPIVGYYLDANCSFDLGKVHRDTRGSMGCHHAVSIDPVVRTRDSTVWRGESEAELSAWILLDSVTLKARMRAALADDEERDSEWYFMPGYWIRYRDGRLVYRWDVVRDGVPVLRIRGERISREVLSEDE